MARRLVYLAAGTVVGAVASSIVWARVAARRDSQKPEPRETLEVLVGKRLGKVDLDSSLQEARIRVVSQSSVPIPPVRARTHGGVTDGNFAVQWRGKVIGRGRVDLNQRLAQASPGQLHKHGITGTAAFDPLSGALWSHVGATHADKLLQLRVPFLTVADEVARYLEAVWTNQLGEFLDEVIVCHLMNHPARRRLLDEAALQLFPLTQLTELLRGVMACGVSIKRLDEILLAVVRLAPVTSEINALVKLICEELNRGGPSFSPLV